MNYPEKPYLPNTRCEWHFAAKSGYAIKIKFEKFELEDEEDGSCSFDYVKITDGSDAGARSLGQICGTKSGQEFKSTGNNIWVQFVTDRIKGKKGFYLKYKRVKLTNHSAG